MYVWVWCGLCVRMCVGVWVCVHGRVCVHACVRGLMGVTSMWHYISWTAYPCPAPSLPGGAAGGGPSSVAAHGRPGGGAGRVAEAVERPGDPQVRVAVPAVDARLGGRAGRGPRGAHGLLPMPVVGFWVGHVRHAGHT